MLARLSVRSKFVLSRFLSASFRFVVRWCWHLDINLNWIWLCPFGFHFNPSKIHKPVRKNRLLPFQIFLPSCLLKPVERDDGTMASVHFIDMYYLSEECLSMGPIHFVGTTWCWSAGSSFPKIGRRSNTFSISCRSSKPGAISMTTTSRLSPLEVNDIC